MRRRAGRYSLVCAVLLTLPLALAADTGGRALDSVASGAAVARERIALFSGSLAALAVDFGERLKGVDPALKRAAARSLSVWIADSRDIALREGVEPIPPDIRAALDGYVPDAVLDRVRWREGGGGVLSLQQHLMDLGYTVAVTLDYVIVFRKGAHAVQDPQIWIHELMHVIQFERWGVEGFATRYVEDHAAIEEEAADFRREWMKLKTASAAAITAARVPIARPARAFHSPPR